MHDPTLLNLIGLLSNPWAWTALVVALLLCFRAGRGLVLTVLIFIDRCFNVLFGGIWRETLSSRAHRMRAKGHPVWGWTANAIDWLFFWQPNHCAIQWAYEVRLGWHD